MKKKYPAKISYGLLSFILIIFLAPLIYEVSNNGISEEILLPLVLLALPLTFILHIFFKTTYTIDNNILNIKCSFIINKDIKITTIKEISKTNSIVSSPAPSLDRIIIKYGKYDEVIISPKNKSDFAKDLTTINPEIVDKIHL